MTGGRTAAQALGQWAASFRLEDAPEPAITHARKALLNSVATAVGGAELPHTRFALAAARALGAQPTEVRPGAAHAIYDGRALSAGQAAFVNGVMVNALGQEETHLPSGTHAAETTAPTVLAQGEALGASGRQVLEAFIVGMQVSGAVGGMSLVWRDRELLAQPPAVYGTMGAAASAAKLLELSAGQMADAIGLAALLTAGPAESMAAGTGDYMLLKGAAGLHGVLAAELARAGAPVAPLALEGPAGFYRVWANIPAAELAAFDVAGDLERQVGQEWVAPELQFKRYPVNYFNQPFIDQARRIAGEEGFDRNAITAIRIKVGPYPARVGALGGTPFGHRSNALMSTRFGVACMLARGRVTLADTLAPDAPEIAELVELAEIEAGAGEEDAYLVIEAGGRTYGGELTEEQRDFRLSAAEVRDIGLGITTDRLGEARASRLIELLDSIEDIPSIGQVVEATFRA
ncbi:MAG: MmgE/PrpD family protein [Bifidobacteriaceae bacterium]|nr:MmgE/PrpD family protein [Bifidobacteriaceae bacterium]